MKAYKIQIHILLFVMKTWKSNSFFLNVDFQDLNLVTFRPRCNGNCDCLLIFQAMTDLLCNSIVSNVNMKIQSFS